MSPSNEVILGVVTGIVTIVGSVIAYLTKKLELKPTSRIKTSDVREIEAERVVEGSHVIVSLQGYVEFLHVEISDMKGSIRRLQAAHEHDAAQLELVTKANYWHRAYEQALIEHINAGKAPPPPAKPIELENLYSQLGINIYEERTHREDS